jgi:hypothetical protein
MQLILRRCTQYKYRVFLSVRLSFVAIKKFLSTCNGVLYLSKISPIQSPTYLNLLALLTSLSW